VLKKIIHNFGEYNLQKHSEYYNKNPKICLGSSTTQAKF
jgi:hypothetical protein